MSTPHLRQPKTSGHDNSPSSSAELKKHRFFPDAVDGFRSERSYGLRFRGNPGEIAVCRPDLPVTVRRVALANAASAGK
jgi:hypothetical protein